MLGQSCSLEVQERPRPDPFSGCEDHQPSVALICSASFSPTPPGNSPWPAYPDLSPGSATAAKLCGEHRKTGECGSTPWSCLLCQRGVPELCWRGQRAAGLLLPELPVPLCSPAHLVEKVEAVDIRLLRLQQLQGDFLFLWFLHGEKSSISWAETGLPPA